MVDEYEQNSSRLRKAIVKHSEANGAEFLRETAANSACLLDWLGYLRASVSNEFAAPLLNGVQASVIEVAACISLGLTRPAIFSMRTEYDLLLAWIYFNDHVVEWEYLQKTGKGSILHSQVLKFLANHHSRFVDRYKILEKSKQRPIDDPYNLTSIHIHSTTAYAVPAVGTPDTMVNSVEQSRKCIELQFVVAEFLSDVLSAWFADRWADFPPSIISQLKSRLTSPNRKEFFK